MLLGSWFSFLRPASYLNQIIISNFRKALTKACFDVFPIWSSASKRRAIKNNQANFLAPWIESTCSTNKILEVCFWSGYNLNYQGPYFKFQNAFLRCFSAAKPMWLKLGLIFGHATFYSILAIFFPVGLPSFLFNWWFCFFLK